MKKITDLELKNKTVLLRVDYNVPIENGIIKDNNRIKQSLETLNYLINQNCKIILLSHLGKVKEEKDKENNSLRPVREELSKLLNKEVFFVSEPKGEELENKVKSLKNKEIILVENTRYMDVPDKLESNCDDELSKYWASLADIFVMDAFGSIHREHASTYGVTKYLESAAGFLVLKEIEELDKVKESNKNIILGGAKVSDKIGLIQNLIENTENIFIGGAMCATFLKAENINVGKTFVDEEKMDVVKDLLKKYREKIIIPVDVVTENEIKSIYEIEDDESILDIGPETVELFKAYLNKNIVTLVNGTMGLFEKEEYENGTKSILEYLHDSNIKTVICGGDTGSAVKKYNLDFYYVSTGGGASLEYLGNDTLPCIEVLK